MGDNSDLDSGFISGTCNAMCPESEKKERVARKLVHRFEVVDGAPGDTSLLIKRHYRIVDSSNNAPEFFRTRHGIARSMDRLRKIMDDESMSFAMRAAFLQDRYRAIWKDMHVQNWTDDFRVMVLEEIARFMILADYYCHITNENMDATKEGSIFADKYDSELGIQLLNQVLVTLVDLYQRLSRANRPCPNEAEFRGYQIILQATPVQGRPVHPLEVHGLIKACPEYILEDLQPILEVQEAFALKDWLRFFDAFRNLRFFSMVLAARMLPAIREHALRTLMKALNPRARPMPMSQFRDLLFLNKNGAINICEAYNLKLVEQENGEFAVDIKGQQRLKKHASKKPPKFGCPIPYWEALEGNCPKSRFVAQIPIASPTPRMDFDLGMLAYPTWTIAINQWSNLQSMTGLSESEAIAEYQNANLEMIWSKIRKTETLPIFTEDHVRTPVKSSKVDAASSLPPKFVFSSPPRPFLQHPPMVFTPIEKLKAHTPGGFPRIPSWDEEPMTQELSLRDGFLLAEKKSDGSPSGTETAVSQDIVQVPEEFREAKNLEQVSAEDAEQDNQAHSQNKLQRQRSDRQLALMLQQQEAAKHITRYKDQVNKFLKEIPAGFQVASTHVRDLWDSTTPFQMPPIVPKAFPVPVTKLDIIRSMDTHPSCGPIKISDLLFQALWNASGASTAQMIFKLLIVAPYMHGGEYCTSLPSYWLLKRLSEGWVGLTRDYEVNQMIEKGPVLAKGTKKMMSRKLDREVELHTTVWQPEPSLIDAFDSHLLANSNGIVLLVDGQNDLQHSLGRLQAIVRHLPKDGPFPKIIALSASQENDSDVLVRMVQKVIAGEGFHDAPLPEAIHITPYLDRLFDEISRNIQKDWVSYFENRGRRADLPDLKWGPCSEERDPSIAALQRIAETGDASVGKRHKIESGDAETRERDRILWMKDWAKWLQEGREKRKRLSPETDVCNPRLSSLILDKVWKHSVPKVSKDVVAKRVRLEEKDNIEPEREDRAVSEPLPQAYSYVLQQEFLSFTLQEKFAFLQRKKDQWWQCLRDKARIEQRCQ